MTEYNFTLQFKLQNHQDNPETFLKQLYESGCDDALIGIGNKGYIVFDFMRQSTSAYQAIESAVKNIKKVIPDAILVAVDPDLVGMNDIATLLNCSRQDVRKFLIAKNTVQCPIPVYWGGQFIWHLADVLHWLVEQKVYPVEESLIDTAIVAMNLNLAAQHQNLDPELLANSKALIAL